MLSHTSVIRANNLAYTTPDGRLLQSGINFDLGAGQLLLIRGANGSGKSTLMRILLSEQKLQSGQLEINCDSHGIHYIPQLENTEVHLPLTLVDVLDISVNSEALSKVRSLGLLTKEQLDSGWSTASGGERKRTLLTRALLSDPKIMFLDEPMNHLDKESRRTMIEGMSRFLQQKRTQGGAIVMVCHQGLSEEEREAFDIVELSLESSYE